MARRHQLMIFSDQDLRSFGHGRGGACFHRLACARSVLRDVLRGFPSRMIAGFRIGWMILSGNKRCARDFILSINMLSNMRLCSNVPAQSIVKRPCRRPERQQLHRSRRSHLRAARFRVQRPQRHRRHQRREAQGGVLHLPKIDVKFNITDDERFALDLLHEKKILITRGGGFNWSRARSFPHRLPAAHRVLKRRWPI